MRFFPVFLNLKGRRCLVVGGGEVAANKLQGLLETEAEATLVAPEATAEIAALEEQGRISRQAREFIPEDLAGCALVIAATDDEQTNRRVAEAATARNIPVNVVDNPQLCGFHHALCCRPAPGAGGGLHRRGLASPGPGCCGPNWKR